MSAAVPGEPADISSEVSAPNGAAAPGGAGPETRPAPGRTPGRFRRALASAAAALGLSVVFVAATGVAVVLHLDAAPTRRIVQTAANRLLGSIFDGKIVVGEIDHLGLGGFDVTAAAAVDPRGGDVIRVSALHAEANVPALLYDALLGRGDLVIEVPLVRIEHGDVLVEPGPAGRFSLEETFHLKPPKTPPTPTPPPKVPPRNVSIALRRIEIGTAWVHGMVAAPRALDGDVSHLVASVVGGPGGVAVDVEQTGLVERGLLPAVTSGSADYHLRADKSIRMWTGFAGQLGSVMVLARATLDGTHLTANGEIPRVRPEELGTVVPGLPITEPLTATVDLDGDIPSFDVSARVSVHPTAGRSSGEISATGQLDAGHGHADVDVTVKGLDPRTFGAALPGARLAAMGRARMDFGAESPRLALDASTDRAEIAGQVVPPMQVHVVIDRGELSGHANLDEAGMPTQASFVLVAKDGLRFEADSEIASIAAAPRLRGPVSGSARVHVAGVLRGETLDANVDGSVAGLKAPGDVRLGHGRVTGRLNGPVDALSLEASLTGSGLHAAGKDFAKVKASARGPIALPRLSAELRDEEEGVLTAAGQLDPKAGAVKGLDVSLLRDGALLRGKIARVAPSGGGVAIEGIALEGAGLGDAHGALQVKGDDITGSLKGEGVDLAQLSRLLGLPTELKGVANVDIAIARGKTGRNGHVKVELEDGEVSLLKGVSALVTATFKDDAVHADGLVRLMARSNPNEKPEDRCEGAIAQVRLDGGEGVMEGPLLSPKTWAGITGKVKVAAEDWDLRCLAKVAPVALVLSDVRGKVTTRFELDRPKGQRFTSVRDVFFRTRGLEIAGPQPFGAEAPEWESRKLDVQLKGELDGASGKTHASVTLFDGQILGDVGVAVDLDLPTLVDRPDQRSASLGASHLTGTISVPRRPVPGFATLPSFVQQVIPPLSGEVRIDGYADGTLDQPFAAVHLLGWKLAPATAAGQRPTAFLMPVDVDALVSYDSKQGALRANLTKDGVAVAEAVASVDADLHALIAAKKSGQRAPWTGSFTGKLNGLPLDDIPFFADRDIGGHVDGAISLTHIHDKPELDLVLKVPDLRVGPDLFFERGEVSMRIGKVPGQDTDRAIGKVELVALDGGRLDGAAYAGITWDDGIVPTVDSGQPADVYAKAGRLRLTTLYPFVAGVLSKLDGYVDGEVRFGWSRASEGEKGSVTADVKVTDGVVHIPQLGQELRNARVHIIADPAGSVRLDDISAEGSSGRLTGWGITRLDGLRFVDAGGQIRIAKGEEVPITLEGVPVGNARGDFAIQAEKHQSEIQLKIGVTNLDVELPAQSTRNVQPLDDNADVSVSHAIGAPREPRDAEALRWAFQFDLGRSHLHGSAIDVYIAGVPGAQPKVELSDKVRVTGDVHVLDGHFLVFDKKFEFQENGLVRILPDDTGNPYVNVTAKWQAPDQEIFVNYVGRLRNPDSKKLRFYSSLGTSQGEIIQTLLFGADKAQSGARTGSQAAGGAAAGVGGSIASSQFNALTKGIAPLAGLTTRIGTSDEGALQTSVSYDIGDTLTADATIENSPTQATGAAGGGDTTRSGRKAIGLDWRFFKSWWGSWSVRGTVGRDTYDQTTSGVDLLWQYRY